MVDDGLVDKAKIGGSNYFWSFPAKKDRLLQLKYEKMLETIESTKIRVEEAKARLADAKRGREDDDDDGGDDKNGGGGGGGGGGERSKKLARLAELATEQTKLETELDALKENDPQAIADLQKELKMVTDAANRWTDNIFNCKSYLVKKRGLEKKEANKYLGITENFDCTYYILYTYRRPSTVGCGCLLYSIRDSSFFDLSICVSCLFFLLLFTYRPRRKVTSGGFLCYNFLMANCHHWQRS